MEPDELSPQSNDPRHRAAKWLRSFAGCRQRAMPNGCYGIDARIYLGGNGHWRHGGRGSGMARRAGLNKLMSTILRGRRPQRRRCGFRRAALAALAAVNNAATGQMNAQNPIQAAMMWKGFIKMQTS